MYVCMYVYIYIYIYIIHTHTHTHTTRGGAARHRAVERREARKPRAGTTCLFFLREREEADPAREGPF